MQPFHRAARRASCAAAFLCVLALPGGAQAADPTEYIGAAVSAVGSAVGAVWSGVSNMIWGSAPYEYLPGQIDEDDQRFFAALEALGLRLSTITVGGGASRGSYRFVAAREPSAVDIRRTEQMLAEYRENASGLRAGAKEDIIQAILDVAGDKTFVLTAVEIQLWPWPWASYEISDRERPPEASERTSSSSSAPAQ